MLSMENRYRLADEYEKWCDKQMIPVKKNALTMITFLSEKGLLDEDWVKTWLDDQERET